MNRKIVLESNNEYPDFCCEFILLFIQETNML
jgi:hypothetical protein